MSVKTRPFDVAEHLKTEEEIKMFIEESIEEAKNDTDPKYLIYALETAARARLLLEASNEVGIDLSETDPRASTLAKIAAALGYRLTLARIAHS